MVLLPFIGLFIFAVGKHWFRDALQIVKDAIRERAESKQREIEEREQRIRKSRRVRGAHRCRVRTPHRR